MAYRPIFGLDPRLRAIMGPDSYPIFGPPDSASGVENMHTDDLRYSTLVAAGINPTHINDMLYQNWAGNTQTNDDEYAFYLGQGVDPKHINDMRYDFLILQGISPGHISDMWYEFWTSGGFSSQGMYDNGGDSLIEVGYSMPFTTTNDTSRIELSFKLNSTPGAAVYIMSQSQASGFSFRVTPALALEVTVSGSTYETLETLVLGQSYNLAFELEQDGTPNPRNAVVIINGRFYVPTLDGPLGLNSTDNVLIGAEAGTTPSYSDITVARFRAGSYSNAAPGTWVWACDYLFKVIEEGELDTQIPDSLSLATNAIIKAGASSPIEGLGSGAWIAYDRFDNRDVWLPPQSVTWWAEGDSNTQSLANGNPFFTTWPAYIKNGLIGDTALGASTMDDVLSRLPTAIAAQPVVIGMTVFTNDFKTWIRDTPLGTSELVFEAIRDNFIEIMEQCLDNNIRLMVLSQQQLATAFWSPTDPEQAIMEPAIDLLNTWLRGVEGPLTIELVDAEPYLDDPKASANNRGFRTQCFANGGPHWGDPAHERTAEYIQPTLALQTRPDPQEFFFDKEDAGTLIGSQIQTDYTFDPTATTRVVWQAKIAAGAVANQGMFGDKTTTNNPSFYTNEALTQCGGTFWGTFPNNVPITNPLSSDVWYTYDVSWGPTGDIAINITRDSDGFVMTNSTTPSGANRAVGGPISISSGPFNQNRVQGVMKNFRIYENDEQVRYWRINDGTNDIFDLITLNNSTLTPDDGFWTTPGVFSMDLLAAYLDGEGWDADIDTNKDLVVSFSGNVYTASQAVVIDQIGSNWDGLPEPLRNDIIDAVKAQRL